MSIFFIADLHFSDERILKYENRPFKNAEEMNEQIIQNWNSVVTSDDKVFVLGDVGEASFVKELSGKKYLIKGNHDIHYNNFYRDSGFDEVYDVPIIYDNYWILSHEPLYVNSNMPYANIFGHVHNNPSYKDCSCQSFCVSVERIKYAPIQFDEIKRKIEGN